MTALTELYKMPHAALLRMIAKEYGLAQGENSAQFLNAHRDRRESIAQRLRLYRDDGELDFKRMITSVFETDVVREQRKKMVEVASEDNVSGRITNEVASLYDQPAFRTFKDDEAMTKRFRDRASDLGLDEVMQEAQRLTFLCNEVLIWQVDDEDGEMSLNVITPDSFDAIPHPTNRLRPVAYLIDTCPTFVPEGSDPSKLKHYELWDDTYTYHLDANGIGLAIGSGKPGDPVAHELGRIPGVLFHRRMPVDRLLDARAGKDITSAHLGCGLLAIMAMRLAKSQGERQPVLQGNLANVAAGQPMDGERPLLLPPEVVASMLDTKTSPEHYLLLKAAKIASIEDTYGIPPKVSAGADVGANYVSRRQKLTELRNEQRRRARVHEKLVVALIGFKADGFQVDHQEQAIPQDAVEEIALLDSKVRMGLDSPVLFMMRKDPDLDRDGAIAAITSNLADWAMLITMLRRLNMPTDASVQQTGNDPADPKQQNMIDKQIGTGLGPQAAPSGANDGSATPKSAYA